MKAKIKRIYKKEQKKRTRRVAPRRRMRRTVVPVRRAHKRVCRPWHWRKPVTSLLHRLFNLNPSRDFGILDETIGGFFVFVIVLGTMTALWGKEVTKTWIATSDTDWSKGAFENTETIGTGTNAAVALKQTEGGWTIQEKPVTDNLTQLRMLSSAEGFAVGENGTILKTNNGGVTWQKVASGVTTNLWSLAFANDTTGFAVGEGGIILEWNGASWKEVDAPAAGTLSSVSMTATRAFAVGEEGKIITWNGSTWSEDTSPTTKTLFGVSQISDRAIAVGEEGTIIKWDGSTWREDTSPTSKTLLAVKVYSSSFAIAVGEGGTILHWNGSTWSKKTSGTTNDLNAVAIASTTVALAGGANGSVTHWNGSQWSAKTLNTSESIFSVALPTATQGIAIGTEGIVATYETAIYTTHGTYTSPTIDAEKAVAWDFIQWSTTTPSKTTLRLQVAVNDDHATWNYVGPDGKDTSFFTENSGQTIPAMLGRRRYLRYRATLETTDQLRTPLLHAVTVRSNEEEVVQEEEKKEEVKKEEPKQEEKGLGEEKKETQKTSEEPIEKSTSPLTQPPPAIKSEVPITPSAPAAPEETPINVSPQTGSGGGGVTLPTITVKSIAPKLTTPSQNTLILNEELTFTWEATPDTPSYTLMIDDATTFDSPLLTATIAELSYTPPTRLAAGFYYWRVRSNIIDTQERRGDWSSLATFTLTDKPPLPKVAAPILTEKIAVSSTEVALEGIAFPFATVRIIITSNIVERTVTADANGVWRVLVPRNLFEGGQHLVQAQIFTEGKVTPAITVGEFFIPFPPPPPKNTAVATARAVQQTAVKAVEATQKAAKKTVEQTVVVAEKTETVIKENETETKVALTAAVPVVTVANPTVLPMLSNLHVLLYHFASGLLSLFGIRKKRRPWGIVYDAITKEPVGLAIVRLLDAGTKKLIETQVTDNEGRFGFLVKPGAYLLEVTKQDFSYPSRIVSARTDGDFEDCYHGDVLKVGEAAINVSIPLDPLNKKEARQKKPLFVTVKNILHTLALPLLIIGWIVSWLTTLFAYSLTNLSMTTIYLFFAIIHVILLPKKWKPWGTVFAAQTFEPIPLAVISLIDTKFNRVLKTRLTDYSGRFNFLPPAGEYKLSIKKEGFSFPVKQVPQTRKYKNLYVGQNIIVKKEKAIVATDVPLGKQ